MKKLALLLTLSTIIPNSFAAVHTPETLLPNGIDTAIFVNPYTGKEGQIRKGTIGATLLNIHTLNQLLTQSPSEDNNETITNIITESKRLIPSLKVLAMFDVFTIEEWLANDHKQPGRCLLGLLYLQQYPKEATKESLVIVENLKRNNTNRYIQKALETI